MGLFRRKKQFKKEAFFLTTVLGNVKVYIHPHDDRGYMLMNNVGGAAIFDKKNADQFIKDFPELKLEKVDVLTELGLN